MRVDYGFSVRRDDCDRIHCLFAHATAFGFHGTCSRWLNFVLDGVPADTEPDDSRANIRIDAQYNGPSAGRNRGV